MIHLLKYSSEIETRLIYFLQALSIKPPLISVFLNYRLKEYNICQKLEMLSYDFKGNL